MKNKLKVFISLVVIVIISVTLYSFMFAADSASNSVPLGGNDLWITCSVNTDHVYYAQGWYTGDHTYKMWAEGNVANVGYKKGSKVYGDWICGCGDYGNADSDGSYGRCYAYLTSTSTRAGIATRYLN